MDIEESYVPQKVKNKIEKLNDLLRPGRLENQVKRYQSGIRKLCWI